MAFIVAQISGGGWLSGRNLGRKSELPEDGS